MTDDCKSAEARKKPETNGRIRIALRDIVAWTILLAGILGQWYDTRSQIALLRQEVALRAQQAQVENARVWWAIEQAQAAERKPRETR